MSGRFDWSQPSNSLNAFEKNVKLTHLKKRFSLLVQAGLTAAEQLHLLDLLDFFLIVGDHLFFTDSVGWKH